MTRKEAVRIEKRLRDFGVRKPYVTKDGDSYLFESYPLEVRSVRGFDRESGPLDVLTLRDCSLPRVGRDSLVATDTVYFGQDVAHKAAVLILAAHAEAYARAKAQDAAFETAHLAVQAVA